MSKLAALLGSVFLAACATSPDEIAIPGLTAGPGPLAAAAAVPPLPADPPPAADVKVVEIGELDRGLVCIAKRKSGSRIAQEVCYPREELAAREKEQAEATKQYLRDLEREQMYRQQEEFAREQERQRAMAR